MSRQKSAKTHNQNQFRRNLMPLAPRRALLLALITIGTLPAATVLTCGFNGALSDVGCYSFPTFSFNETLDWQTAYGDANGTHATTYDPVTGPWIAPATASGLLLGATFGPAYSGTDLISRVDNFAKVAVGDGFKLASREPGYADWQTYAGTFGAAPDLGAGSPGDHLLNTSGGVGALELQFNRGISGALFRISTPTSGDVNATVAAYGVLNPTALDTPLMRYTINAHANGGPTPGGTCATLSDPALITPIPCNNAPYIGIQTGAYNIRSLVISTPDGAGGLYIDTLYLSDASDPSVPEPSTFALTGIAGILALLGRRRMQRDQKS